MVVGGHRHSFPQRHRNGPGERAGPGWFRTCDQQHHFPAIRQRVHHQRGKHGAFHGGLQQGGRSESAAVVFIVHVQEYNSGSKTVQLTCNSWPFTPMIWSYFRIPIREAGPDGSTLPVEEDQCSVVDGNVERGTRKRRQTRGTIESSRESSRGRSVQCSRR